MDIDNHLISRARRFITGANVHFVKTLIFCYESSLPDSPRRRRYESLLRDFVFSMSQLTKVRERVEAQRVHLTKLVRSQATLNRRIEKLLASSSD